MLQVIIPAAEYWDERKGEFVYVKEQTLQLEHSLVSLAKWESKWKKPYLAKENKTREETLDYIRCMTITQNVDPLTYEYIPNHIINQINDYINDPMTAAWFKKEGGGKTNSEQTTSELIYYWMISLNIPFDCQKWHLNRLLALIRVCEAKNRPSKKMNARDVMKQNRAINEARRKRLNTRG